MAKGFRKKRSPILALTAPAGIAYTDSQEAETLANSLENHFQLNDIHNPDLDNQHMRVVDRFFINDNNFNDTSPPNYKPSELINYIKKMKIMKAPGRDSVENRHSCTNPQTRERSDVGDLPSSNISTPRPQQPGFRANLSTSHQLLRVVEYVKSRFVENKSTGAVFLDIQTAFDRVWHSGLLYKLIRIDIVPPIEFKS
ncbi:putative RNA-directed DNA polymerase from transposon X-element [Trichonephila clavipes]|uniref:Putative RNA-directed DNA polymerase from transposon X-element n=1 Tax=Trichonephila clavipes TaxID=2585209 RepID=A0A8X7BDY4_TRICX|nr:putative RNA-directed DNA polymerase from transposon X-element [Trichonephila clavipes]